MSNNIYDILKKFNNLDSVKNMLTEGKKVCKDCGKAKCECVTESKGSKPDFLDMDKDGDKKEPMKSAAKDKSKGAVAEAVARVEQQLAEKYQGFNKTVAAIKKSGSADNPEAVAASIGRKKYGKAKFQKAAAAGKKLGEASSQHDTDWVSGAFQKVGSYEKRAKLLSSGKLKQATGWKEAEPATAESIKDPSIVHFYDRRTLEEAMSSMEKQVRSDVKKTLNELFGQIYDYGDSGLEFLDNNAATWYKLWDKHDGNISKIAMNTPFPTLKKAITELKGVISQMQFELDLDEDMLSPGQKKIAHMSPPPDKIDANDLAALRAGKKKKSEGNAFSGAVAKAKATGQDEFEVGGKEYKVQEGFPTVADAKKRMDDKAGKTAHGTKTVTKTGVKHERNYDADEPTGERGRPKKDKFAK